MSYEGVLESSLKSLIEKYQKGEYRFLDENSLRSALFFECLDTIDSLGLKREIEPNAPIPGTNCKADLILGGKVVCELKFEPRYPTLFDWKSKKNVVIWSEVLSDISRLETCLKSWALFSHFIIIDEIGKWGSKIIQGGWQPLPLLGWTSYMGHIRGRLNDGSQEEGAFG